MSNQQPNIKLQAGNNVPLIYVEGISQMGLGFPNSRLIFHSFASKTENGNGIDEVHNVAVELVIPTSSLVEMLKTLTNQLSINQEQIKQFGDEWIHKVNDSLDSLGSTETVKHTDPVALVKPVAKPAAKKAVKKTS
jgi:hypothetical protein